MLMSRALGLLRRTAPQLGRIRKNPTKNQSRRSHDNAHHDHDPADGWVYRNAPKPQQAYEIAANCVGGFMWWWIFYHLYHDFDHLCGYPGYPDPREWTDAELGIPPDDEVYEKFNPEACVYPAGFYDRK